MGSASPLCCEPLRRNLHLRHSVQCCCSMCSGVELLLQIPIFYHNFVRLFLILHYWKNEAESKNPTVKSTEIIRLHSFLFFAHFPPAVPETNTDQHLTRGCRTHPVQSGQAPDGQMKQPLGARPHSSVFSGPTGTRSGRRRGSWGH